MNLLLDKSSLLNFSFAALLKQVESSSKLLFVNILEDKFSSSIEETKSGSSTGAKIDKKF